MILQLLEAFAAIYATGIFFTLVGLALVSATDASGDASLGIAAIGFFWPYALFVGLREELSKAWKESAKSADGKHLTHSEFRALLCDGIDSGRVSVSEIAGYLQVAPNSVRAWAKGNTAPHPALRRHIIDYVHGRGR